jgi:hypothetical protein
MHQLKLAHRYLQVRYRRQDRGRDWRVRPDQADNRSRNFCSFNGLKVAMITGDNAVTNMQSRANSEYRTSWQKRGCQTACQRCKPYGKPMVRSLLSGDGIGEMRLHWRPPTPVSRIGTGGTDVAIEAADVVLMSAIWSGRVGRGNQLAISQQVCAISVRNLFWALCL